MDNFQSFLKTLNESKVDISTLQKINNAITQAGGEIFVVGGPIRDFVLGHDPKDIDFLVRKLSLEQIQRALVQIGKPKEVGQQFGIVKANIDNEEFDFAIPRTKEDRTGDKHTDFTVQVDPNASVEDDLKRRDFTWNAMAVPLSVFINVQAYPKEKAIELLKNAVIDPNNGLSDLENGVLKAVGDPLARFGEDHLRMLRAIQFATRMGFDISGETAEAIRSLSSELASVSGERIFEEFKKAWTKGKADTETFVTLLWKLEVGEKLFGPEFNPFIIKLPHVTKPEDKISGQLVAFFLNGGNYTIMKPDAKYIKLIETTKLIKNSKDYPHSYIGNLTDQDLAVLSEVFKEIDPEIHQKVEKMRQTPMRGKELAVDGPTLAQVMGITDKKDFPKIGMAQKKVLSALWDGQISNNPGEIAEFIKNSAIKEEYFKPNPIAKEQFSFTTEREFDESVSNIIENFIKHAISYLRLAEVPKISFLVTRKGGMTHGAFNPTSEEIMVYVVGRSLADFLRTLAHELVHFHQRKVGKIELNQQYQDVGGDLEDEANAIGGQIIKSYGKKVKEIYDL
jgi:tRNA nucleotidyltransferase/poly(A) polymerase